jgi:hypothetical protein
VCLSKVRFFRYRVFEYGDFEMCEMCVVIMEDWLNYMVAISSILLTVFALFGGIFTFTRNFRIIRHDHPEESTGQIINEAVKATIQRMNLKSPDSSTSSVVSAINEEAAQIVHAGIPSISVDAALNGITKVEKGVGAFVSDCEAGKDWQETAKDVVETVAFNREPINAAAVTTEEK